jgi:DNA gyrase/topoisomerase IV subunit A
MRVAPERHLVAVAPGRTDQPLLGFTSLGRVIRSGLSELPVNRSGAGQVLFSLERGEELAAVATDDGPFFLVVTSGGGIKRFSAETIAKAGPAGITCCRVPDGETVVTVVPHDEPDDILLAKASGHVLRIEVGKLRPVSGGAAGVVAGVKVEAGDRVVSAARVEGGTTVLVHRGGHGICIATDELPRKGRGSNGVQGVHPSKPAKSPAGDLVLVATTTDSELAVFSTAGELSRLTTTDPVRRAAVSRSLMSLEENDSVAGAIAGTALMLSGTPDA